MGKRGIGPFVVALALALPWATALAQSDPSATEQPCLTVVKGDAANRQRIEACTALLRMEASGERRVRFLIARSQAYYETKAPLRALGDLRQVEAIEPRHIAIAFDRALVYVAMGYYARALPEIETAMRQGNHSAEAYGVRGAIYAFEGRFGDALQDLEISIVSNPALAETHTLRGFANLESGEIDRALADFDDAIRLNPQDNNAVFYRARAHLALDQYPQALADFQLARRLMPDEPGPADYIDDVEAMMAAPAASRADADAPAPALVPSKPVGGSHNCAAYYPFLSARLSEHGDVLIHYDVAADGTLSSVGLDRSSGFERLDRAAVICVSRHWRNTPALLQGVPIATPHHQAIIRYMPYRKMPFDSRRGETLAGLGDYDGAIADFSRLIGESPDYADAYFRRGFVYYLQQDYAKAIRDFDRAIQLKPGDDDAIAARELADAAAIAAAPAGRKGI